MFEGKHNKIRSRFLLQQLCWLFFALKRNATYVWNSLPGPTLLSSFLPIPQSLYGWREYADVISKFSGIDRFKKEINCNNHGRRFTEEGRYRQPKYCYEKAIYVVIISFALVSLSSSLTMGYRQHEFRLNKGYLVVSGHLCPYISCSKAWKHALF